MLMLRVLLAIALFLGLGEVIVRLDQKYQPFSDGPGAVKLETRFADTEEFRAVTRGQFAVKDDDFRIMVLGDSYIHAGGLPYEQSTPARVKDMLGQMNQSCSSVQLLDLSRPGNNTPDNFNNFRKFSDRFQPHVVVLGYVLRDVLGPVSRFSLSEPLDVQTSNDAELQESALVKKDHGIYRIVNPLRRHSRLFKYVNTNLQRFLKTKGIVIPHFGSLHQVINNSYADGSENWLLSRAMIDDMVDAVNQADGRTVVYYIPEMNILEHGDIYAKPNAVIDAYFSQLENTAYFNGLTSDFANLNSSDGYFLSKYDGHASAKAHEIMATTIVRTISDTWTCQ